MAKSNVTGNLYSWTQNFDHKLMQFNTANDAGVYLKENRGDWKRDMSEWPGASRKQAGHGKQQRQDDDHDKTATDR